jgi:hypothetical protein
MTDVFVVTTIHIGLSFSCSSLRDLPLSQEINVRPIEELCGRNAEQSHEVLRLVDTRRGGFTFGKNHF